MSLLDKQLITNYSLKKNVLKGSLVTQKWLFDGITLKSLSGTFTFKMVWLHIIAFEIKLLQNSYFLSFVNIFQL